MHGVIESEQDEEESFQLSEPVTVKCTADLIGKRACIAYEDNLKQLATLVQLPICKCNSCSCVEPFEFKTKTRGSAIIIEWVSLPFPTHKAGLVHSPKPEIVNFQWSLNIIR